jgi:hypothetical protein
MLYKYYLLDGTLVCTSTHFDLWARPQLRNFTGYIEVPYWDAYEIQYYKNSLIHREDGPACILHNGNVEYWLNGKKLKIKAQEQFQLLVDLMKLKGLL